MNQPDLQSNSETYYFSVAHYHPIPLLIFLLVAALIVIIPYWKIFGKAGFPCIFGLFHDHSPRESDSYLRPRSLPMENTSITNRKSIGGSFRSNQTSLD